MSRLLILGAGIESVTGIKTAREMGHEVWVVDHDKDAPGIKFANGWIGASIYYDSTGIIDRLTGARFDGVIAMSTDCTQTVVAIAKELGLPSVGEKVARVMDNKYVQKVILSTSGIPVPKFTAVGTVLDFYDALEEMGYPCVLKPVDSRGARGVMYLDKWIDVDKAYNESMDNSPSKQLILEEYLEGEQYSTESIFWDDHVVHCAITHRHYDSTRHLRPFMIEDGGEVPAPDVDERRIHSLIERSAKALGLKRGTFKGDIVVTKEGPKVIEFAARLSGGDLSSYDIPTVYGVNIITAAINIALGVEPYWENLKPKAKCHTAHRYLWAKPGRVKHIYKPANSAKYALIRPRFDVKEGDVVVPVEHHSQRVGKVIAVSRTMDGAITAAEQYQDSVRIEVE